MERMKSEPVGELTFAPLTAETWVDFERLFGAAGACGGCRCILFRLSHQEFEQRKGEDNRLAMRALAESPHPPGVLAYAGGVPIGWCAVAPREAYPRLGRSRILKPVDAQPVWSIVCFFVARGWRGKGVSVQLIRAAVRHAAAAGATAVEGYPIEPRKDRTPDVFAHTGLASAFRAAGFTEVARRSETRPVMRLQLTIDN
jgi:GNAT superfamily N-acetyltransferase